MPRTAAALPAGTRLTDFVSLGVLTVRFPIATVHAVLARTGRASERERALPAPCRPPLVADRQTSYDNIC